MSVATQANGSASAFQPNASAAAAVNGAPNGAAAASSGANPASSAGEVGWLFVPQYYTFMNEKPERLHCFYTKNSTFMHGSEDESELKAYYGQQEIHKKILSLGLVNCQVFVTALDSQASANGGIIIQVLGDMSNDKGPWRKFAQTFFLAEQPNGYYVLNDIFRYLKDEDDEHHHDASDGVEEAIVENEVANGVEADDILHEAPAAAPFVEAPAVTTVSQPAEVTPTTSIVPPVPETSTLESSSAKDATPAQPKIPEAAEPLPEDKAVEEPTPEPVAAPVKSEVKPAPVAAATPAPPAPAPVAKPGTWASLAATGKDKWGAAVSSESRGVTANRAPAPSRAAPPSQQQQQPQQQQQQQQAGQSSAASGSGPSAAMKAAMSQTHGHCFVKSVIPEKVTKEALEQALTSRFGPLKECSVVPAKACAFVEFASVDGARRAIAMSLKPEDGGEGGVPIGNGWSVTVGEKKEKKDRPPPSQRTGGPQQRTNSNSNHTGGARGDYTRGPGRGGAAAGSARSGRDGASAAA